VNDARDWIILGLVTLIWLVATAFLFVSLFLLKTGHAAEFGIWAGVVSTVTGVYHWLNLKDSKTPDAD
jgi:hypothetical protein